MNKESYVKPEIQAEIMGPVALCSIVGTSYEETTGGNGPGAQSYFGGGSGGGGGFGGIGDFGGGTGYGGSSTE
jgi:hypothetical protein